MTEGGPHNLRGGDRSAYLATDSMSGGNTYSGNNVEPTISEYENVFGPSGRDVKVDQERNKRRGRWHLPDILKGPNQYLTDRVDGLITDPKNSPYTTFILPYKQIDNPDGKIKWNVWSFDEGLASRVPYESAARTLTQSKRSFKGFPVRHGLALNLEHNFMMSEAGRRNFHNQLNQLIGSIQMTNDLDVHIALLLAPSYEKHMREKYILDTDTPSQKCRQFVDVFGFMQKNVNALDILIEEAKARLRSWGADMPDFLLANSKLTFGLQMTPERTNYQTQGPEGAKRLKQGPEIDSYRGINIVHSRSFSMETGVPPRDVLRRRVRVAEYYRVQPSDSNVGRNWEFYNEDRDTWFSMSFADLLRASLLPGHNSPDDELLRLMATLKPEDINPNNRRLTPSLVVATDAFKDVDIAIVDLITDKTSGVLIDDFIFAPGYRNPSTKNNPPAIIPKDTDDYGQLKWIQKGIVSRSQHGLKEFLRIAVNDNIPPHKMAIAFRVFQQFGGVQFADGPIATSLPRYTSDTLNIDRDDFVLFTDGACAAALCPNWVAPAGNTAEHKYDVIAKYGLSTSEINRYLLGTTNNSDAGGDFRNTLLWRLVNNESQHKEAFVKFQKILSDTDLGRGNTSAPHIAIAFSQAIRDCCPQLATTVTLADLVFSGRAQVGGITPDDTADWKCPTAQQLIDNLQIGQQPLTLAAATPVISEDIARQVLKWFMFRYFSNRLLNGGFIDSGFDTPGTNFPAADLFMGDFYVPPAEDNPKYEAIKQLKNVEIVIVRPNIEHNMFGIILGKGGESLGSTFWGQTELSCYDDAQHGIWGMSYKYHERAIVINERNLVRLWDVSYDGYVGGKDDRVVKWNAQDHKDRDSVHNFQESTRSVNKNYHGPSMMVMAFIHSDADEVREKTWQPNWPSPMIFHDQMYDSSADQNGIVVLDPEQCETIQTAEFRVFDRSIPGYSTRYDQYYRHMPNFTQMALNRKPAGAASSENEVCSDMLAFQGSMRVREANGGLTEVNGSGHHGHDFVGVASLRAGKGYRIQSQPQLARAA